MKNYCSQLRRGDQIENIDLYIDDGDEDDEIIRHDDVLLPHWDELIYALVQYQKFSRRNKYGIQIFGIRYFESHGSSDMLAPVLKTTPIERFSLDSTGFGERGVSFFADIVRSNPNLTDVAWRPNPVDRVDDIQRLCKSTIRSNADRPRKTLGLYSSFNGNYPEILHLM